MIVKTYCARMDHGGCGILAHVENGKIMRIEGDPDSPLNRGTICAKGLARPQRLNHPDRLTYPMRRMGKRGEGEWKRISWDDNGPPLTILRSGLLHSGLSSAGFIRPMAYEE